MNALKKIYSVIDKFLESVRNDTRDIFCDTEHHQPLSQSSSATDQKDEDSDDTDHQKDAWNSLDDNMEPEEKGLTHTSSKKKGVFTIHISPPPSPGSNGIQMIQTQGNGQYYETPDGVHVYPQVIKAASQPEPAANNQRRAKGKSGPKSSRGLGRSYSSPDVVMDNGLIVGPSELDERTVELKSDLRRSQRSRKLSEKAKEALESEKRFSELERKGQVLETTWSEDDEVAEKADDANGSPDGDDEQSDP